MSESTPRERMTFVYPKWYTQTELERARRDARAEGNQRHVRDTLAARAPQYAQALERAVRELSPRARGRSR